MKIIRFPLRAIARLALTVKFYGRLGYSWHLAWVKSAR
jgi:hypothetical protein